jgi:hypothetical protein
MNTLFTDKTDWYLRMLMPLSDEVKLDLIGKLIATMSHHRKEGKKTASADVQLFEGISGAWIDDVSPEEETRKIREARTSGVTRNIDTF